MLRRLVLLLILCALTVVLLIRPNNATTATDSPDSVRQAYFQQFLDDQIEPLDLEAHASMPCENGLAGGIYDCQAVDLLSFLPLGSIGGGSGNDIWGWTDPETGSEYAIMGRSSGTSFVDITDPVNPVYLGNLPTQTAASSWRDVKVYANHAFVVSEAPSHGMQVFDLTRLRDVSSPPVTFNNDAFYNGFGSAHNVVINEDSGYAYGVGASSCSGGLHMVDVSTPTSPTFAGCFSDDGYTHDAQCIIYDGPDTEHDGKEICFNSNEDTMTIVDVTNKSNPIQLARKIGWPGCSAPANCYIHQSWVTEDHQYMLVDDELDEQGAGKPQETYIWDIRDLDNPLLIDRYESGLLTIDHNQYILGNLSFQANYRSGLRILDISDIANGNLVESAYFDIFPGSDGISFNGAWSVYPYFESGSVIISGIESGLFVVKPNEGFGVIAEPNPLDVCLPNNGVLTTSVNGYFGYSGTVNLSVDGNLPDTTLTLAAEQVAAGSTTDLTISPAADAPSGTYELIVRGVAGDLSAESRVNISYWQQPTTPYLHFPQPGATEISLRPQFKFGAGEAENYLIEIATDANFTTIIHSDTITDFTYRPNNNFELATTYYWRVTSNNPCGSSETAVGSFTTKDLPVCNAQTIAHIDEGFDSPELPDGWEVDGFTVRWDYSEDDPFAGSGAWKASVPVTISDQWLISPKVKLNTYETDLNLTFWQRYDLATTNGVCNDAGVLEISADDGASWQALNRQLFTTPYTARINGFSNSLNGRSGWCGQSDWVETIVDLDEFAGSTVQFRFRLGTDLGGSSDGWFIDEVAVEGCFDGSDIHLPILNTGP